MKKIIVVLIFITTILFAQENSIYVDKYGILRWKDNDKELRLFGVNYTTPFAYAYRAHKRLGLSLKRSIDLDVEHFVRLKLDAFRIHIWDREISDREGNLIINEHLDLFDYLLYKLSQKGIKIILTPIAWWGTAWPEPEFETSGFSNIYTKIEMITNENARKAQKNYLRQILNHKNPYTKFTYKDDPAIIALEIINEPHHPEDTSLVRNYINEMYDVIRQSGFTKPIFYNISENWDDLQAQAVCDSKIDGVSFQWYPTGLVHNKMLEGNYLININKYKIPAEKIKGFNSKAKMIYEFDAADIGASYMYPVMARSFVEAGIQFAAMFSYDPVQIAWSNTEYQTHFVNLLYTPSKAISLMIASKAFHQLPLYKSFGDFPLNNVFENFKVDYENDLSEYISTKEFIYSNSTNSFPPFVDSLIYISGVGSSPIISYSGTGAYFFEKIEDGIWKLEVYPDVLWLNDPFENVSMSKQIAKLFWNNRKFKVSLKNLDEHFIIQSLVDGYNYKFITSNGEFVVRPGIYLLFKTKINRKTISKYLTKKIHFLDKLYLPGKDEKKVYVINKSPSYIQKNGLKKFLFQIASDYNIDEANLFIRKIGWRGFEKYKLHNLKGFDYIITDSIKSLSSGTVEYCIVVKINNKYLTFPDGIETSPNKWDFYYEKLWQSKILDIDESIVVFNPLRDYKNLIFPQFTKSTKFTYEFKNGSNSESSSILLNINSTGEDYFSFGFQLNVTNIVKALKNRKVNNIFLTARSKDSIKIEFNIITKSGKCYSVPIILDNDWKEYQINLSKFTPCMSLILPYSYPKFLPKLWESKNSSKLNELYINDLEAIQFILRNVSSNKQNFSAEIESVILN